MGRYLTNIDLLDRPGLTAADYRAAVKDAARKARVKVEYRSHPMPNSAAGRMTPPDPDVASLYTREGFRDLTAFWQLYDIALARILANRES